MNEPDRPLDNTPARKDDLQQIKGIGPSIAQNLIDLGIDSFERLAEFTPDRLASLLKGRIPGISPEQVKNKDWIGQAHLLALAKQGAAPEEVEPPVQSGDHWKEEKAAREGWRELADFFVSFGYAIGPDGEERLQTKVHHSQADRLEKWDGISTQHLLDWMFAQANLRTSLESETSFVGDEVGAESSTSVEPAQEAQLEIAELWVKETQAPAAGRESEPLTRLQADARLILSGLEATDLTNNQIPFTIDFYMVNTLNNHSELVATTSATLSPGQLVYDVQEAFQIPPVGRYQLFVVARLSPPGTLVTHLQGPTIRVEPQSQKNASTLRG